MKPIVLTTFAGLIVLAVFGGIVILFKQQSEQRRASCSATLAALEAAQDTAAAGIRPVVPASDVASYPRQLRALALRQRQATINENTRRRDVIATVEKAKVALSQILVLPLKPYTRYPPAKQGGPHTMLTKIAALTAAVTAVLNLAVLFGLDLSVDQIAGVNVAIVAVGTAIHAFANPAVPFGKTDG